MVSGILVGIQTHDDDNLPKAARYSVERAAYTYALHANVNAPAMPAYRRMLLLTDGGMSVDSDWVVNTLARHLLIAPATVSVIVVRKYVDT